MRCEGKNAEITDAIVHINEHVFDIMNMRSIL